GRQRGGDLPSRGPTIQGRPFSPDSQDRALVARPLQGIAAAPRKPLSRDCRGRGDLHDLRARARRRPGMTPRCSIVVPVRNHAGLTRRCLDAILAEPPATETEIIVVDDASTDATPDLVAAYGGALRSITRPENGGFAAACNDGAEVARGHYL